MRKAEIQTGQDYAVDVYGTARRALIIEVGPVDGRSRGTGRYGLTPGHRTTTVKAAVQFYGYNGQLSERVEHVVLSKVLRTWAEQVEVNARVEARKNDRDAALKEVEDEVIALTGERIYFARHENRNNGDIVGYARVSAATLKKLIEAAKGA